MKSRLENLNVGAEPPKLQKKMSKPAPKTRLYAILGVIGCVVAVAVAVVVTVFVVILQESGSPPSSSRPPPPSPSPPPGGPFVVSVVTGYWHTCALLNNGTVLCWGYNTDGELGLNTTESTNTPSAVKSLPSDVVSIAAGGLCTCAIRANGNVLCWGASGCSADPSYAPLDLTPNKIPKNVFPDGKAVWVDASITGGLYISSKNGSLFSIYRGQTAFVGDNNSTAVVAAQFFHTVSNTYTAIGDLVGCTLELDVLTCSFTNFLNSVTSFFSPITSVLRAAKAVAGFGNNICSLLTNGSVACVGNNDQGQYGNGKTDSLARDKKTFPDWSRSAGGGEISSENFENSYWGNLWQNITLVHLPGPATAISVGDNYACAILANTSAACWGLNSNGQLGDGTTENRLLPVLVANLTGATSLSCGGKHACAALITGKVKCWGYNTPGQLGLGVWDGNHYSATEVFGL
jgi:alpha-tubulin suppressor-like RCC1 family protein